MTTRPRLSTFLRVLALGLVLLPLAGCKSDQDRDGGTTPADGGDTPGPDPMLDATAPAEPPVNGSAGCVNGTLEPGSTMAMLEHDGVPRDYVLHVPAGYDASTPVPLIVNMHGFLSNYVEQPGLTGMSELADERGVLVVYPNGAGELPAWNGGDCCAFGADAQDDVGFVSALIDTISEQACVDVTRVYATGYSNGGFLSHRLACELSDRIAAIATVAGVLGVPPETCTPEREVPVLMFHGDADMTVPYAGGSPMGWELLYPDQTPPVFRSAAETAEFWRAHDNCAETTTTTFMMGDTTCVRYDGCQNGSEVTLCTITGGGHTWPGGDSNAFLGAILGLMIKDLVGVTSTAIDASEEILEHPLE
jgi:polyhydroxybutyrate depolymerase